MWKRHPAACRKGAKRLEAASTFRPQTPPPAKQSFAPKAFPSWSLGTSVTSGWKPLPLSARGHPACEAELRSQGHSQAGAWERAGIAAPSKQEVDRSPPRTPCGLPWEGISFHSVRRQGHSQAGAWERGGNVEAASCRLSSTGKAAGSRFHFPAADTPACEAELRSQGHSQAGAWERGGNVEAASCRLS